ncbi:hypothetical protein [Streptomyces acidiscabies]|uniref:Uncharacterized protein n=1 Tax=Streptomyces acidiscabies TaxID=42234 RepID=A0ABU4LWZ7_9ACTN|nr:hypothetical protein [Streptomyces acidiscabies]MDX3019997.1 hypothetical protein [Streptomyces acidiscabies]
MQEYTMAGIWDDGDDLEVDYVGVGLSETVIEGLVADSRGNIAFTHTTEAMSDNEAFRVLGDDLGADTVWDCRDGKRRKVYTQPEDEGEDAASFF